MIDELWPGEHEDRLRAAVQGAYDTPTVPCPYCGEECEADFVDVGVGMVQCGPYHCTNCLASEIGPEGDADRSDIERKTGWYGPGEPASPYANTVQGTIVDHKTARRLYEMGLLDAKPTKEEGS